MDRNLSELRTLSLEPDHVVAFRRARGLTITCRQGEIWVTEDGDPRDVVLRAGERISLERPGRALVSAFVGSTLSVQERRTAGPFAAAMKGIVDGLRRVVTHDARPAEAVPRVAAPASLSGTCRLA